MAKKNRTIGSPETKRPEDLYTEDLREELFQRGTIVPSSFTRKEIIKLFKANVRENSAADSTTRKRKKTPARSASASATVVSSGDVANQEVEHNVNSTCTEAEDCEEIHSAMGGNSARRINTNNNNNGGAHAEISELRQEIKNLQEVMQQVVTQVANTANTANTANIYQTTQAAGCISSSVAGLGRIVKGRYGVVSQDIGQVVCVSSHLRQQIQAGKYINLALLLNPECEQAEIRTIADGQGNEIRLKGGQDPKLMRTLTFQEFVRAFLRYINIVGEKADRKDELLGYLQFVTELNGRHGNQLFYEYHKEFFTRAATLLVDYSTKIDWSVGDHDLVDSLVARMKASHCLICLAQGHTTQQCHRRQDSSLNPIDVQGRRRIRCNGTEICNNFNSFRGCSRNQCLFLHVCTTCRQDHSRTRCPRSGGSDQRTNYRTAELSNLREANNVGDHTTEKRK